MRSAGRSDFVRILPWVVCLALGAAAHLLWALDAWFQPRPRVPAAPVVVHVTPPPAVAPTTIVVRDRVVRVRRTESPNASDPELLRMLVNRHVRCDGNETCTIDPRLVTYLLAPPVASLTPRAGAPR